MKSILVALNTFFAGLSFDMQRGVAPDVDPPYGRWDVLDQTKDDGQSNYASEEYGQLVVLTIDLWGETGTEAADTFDALKAAFLTTPISPTGMRLLMRPKCDMARPMRDPDTSHHKVNSRWTLRFTPTE